MRSAFIKYTTLTMQSYLKHMLQTCDSSVTVCDYHATVLRLEHGHVPLGYIYSTQPVATVLAELPHLCCTRSSPGWSSMLLPGSSSPDPAPPLHPSRWASCPTMATAPVDPREASRCPSSYSTCCPPMALPTKLEKGSSYHSCCVSSFLINWLMVNSQ